MGSGISLCEKQICEIIERGLIKDFDEIQKKLPVYTDDGYEIYRDFSDEVVLNNTIKEVYGYMYYKKLKTPKRYV